MATLFEQLDAMLNLKENWDGYGADRIQPGPVAFAKEFIHFLLAAKAEPGRTDMYVTPGRDGGVMVEWQDEAAEHELEVNPDGSLGFLHVDKATGQMTTRTVRPEPVGGQPEFLTELRSLIAA